MEIVGIKELKNRLTYYLRLTRKGDKIIVTDRGSPVAVLHGLDAIEATDSLEEKLAALAGRGMIKLPAKPVKFSTFKRVVIAGKPMSQIIIEERR
jgi:prevent-host-death family protein